MASVTTMVVMSSLSAAGSRMLPSTVPMLYLRASHPSTCDEGKRKSARASALDETPTHQIRDSGHKEESCGLSQLAL